MPRYTLTPERLFDRPWRPGRPFRAKMGRGRRLGMAVLLAFLSVVIFGYAHLTDSERLGQMAESYLSDLIGGRVKVRRATLSVFEGLRLDDVTVYVDDAPAARRAADAEIFSARTFVIQYDFRAMLRGQLEATQIVAEKPHVQLTRDVARGTWNFHRLGQSRRDRPKPPTPSRSSPGPLPELLLRNAKVELYDLRGGARASYGFLAIDGQLSPEPNGRYGFMLQSRAANDSVGALIDGWVELATGRMSAGLKKLKFDQDVWALLPEELRVWCARHQLAGRVNVPTFDYTPATRQTPPRFTVVMTLEDAGLTVPPEEWMSAREVRRRDDTRDALGAVGALYAAAGFTPAAAVPATPATAEAAEVGRVPPAPRLKNDDPRPATPAGPLADLLVPRPVPLRKVAGTFVFTEAGLAVQELTARLEDNAVKIDGRIDGYRPDAPMALRITSADPAGLTLPPTPGYVWSLPRDVRELYRDLRPQGTCRLRLDAARTTEGGPLVCEGVLDLLDGQFVLSDFPYPLRDVTGQVRFGRDPTNGWDWVTLRDVRGKGLVDGPNRNGVVTVNGWIGPIGPAVPDAGFNLQIVADDLTSEPTLVAALDRDVRDALKLFDAPGKGEYPRFRGRVGVHVARPIGFGQRFTFDTDIRLADATGVLAGFPYPLRGVTGDLKIRDGYLDVSGVRVRRDDATIGVDGRVAWITDADWAKRLAEAGTTGSSPARPETDLHLKVQNLPVDGDLLAALPPDPRQWLRRTGVRGRLDVDGQLRAAPKAVAGAPDSPLAYDLGITFHDGSARPEGGTFEVAGVAGKLRLTPDRLDVAELAGRRGAATLSGSGRVSWPGGRTVVALTGSARNLALDKPLYDLLPAEARDAWDEVRPAGTIDADVTYATPDPAVDPTGVVAVDLTQTVTPLPIPHAPPPTGLHATLRPRALAVNLKSVPYPLDSVGGAISISPGVVLLKDVTARRGDARLALSGTGTLGGRTVWDLRVAGEKLPVNDDLRQALPPAVLELTDALKLRGEVGFNLSPLVYRGAVAAGGGNGQPPVAAAGAEMDFAGSVFFADAGIDVGVPLGQVNGAVRVTEAAVRGGRLHSLKGNFDLATLTLGGRELKTFKAALDKPAGKSELTLTGLQARLAGGDLAGQVALTFPDDGPSRYRVGLAVRNADVRELAGEEDQNLAGRLTASLSLEGAWGKPAERRGRGDVVVAGKDMYRIPLVLGLLQVTNLALPISAPFENAVARYSVEGEKIIFERVELRSNNMLMSGDGQLDFATKQVRMNFVTDNPGGFKIPFLQDLWRGAQHELLRIHVRGTVKEPKVHTSTMGTFTTTVDEVLNGDPPRNKAKK